MTCKEFERMVPLYFQNELEEKELKEFIGHLMSCEVCKEEMAIQYLITEGMQRLEDGNTLDLEKELEEKLMQSLRHLEMKRKFRHLLILTEVAAGILCAGAMVYFISL